MEHSIFFSKKPQGSHCVLISDTAGAPALGLAIRLAVSVAIGGPRVFEISLARRQQLCRLQDRRQRILEHQRHTHRRNEKKPENKKQEQDRILFGEKG